jgi:hypothetical protein
LMGGRQRSLLLGDVAEAAEAVAATLAPRYSERPQRQSSLELSEVSAHTQFMAGFGGDAIWFRYLAQSAPA